jgi:Arc/MetJ-type ribon-helix-helix transcriptional regulator
MGNKNPLIGARVPPVDERRIRQLVDEGKFCTASDFIRKAVSEKLAKVEAAA